MFGHCDKKMQAQIKESPDFESKIQNDPIELLKIVKTKTHDPSRTKCEHVLETLENLTLTLMVSANNF